MRRLAFATITLIVTLMLSFSSAASADFCATRIAEYGDYATLGSGIVKCIDFAVESDAQLRPEYANPHDPTSPFYNPVFTSNWFWDSATTSTADGTGALQWIVKSVEQVKSEFPGFTWLQALDAAKATGGNFWWRWLGVNFFAEPAVPSGNSLYVQFKMRFNTAFKDGWGGGGQKMWGLTAGPRLYNEAWIPESFNPITGGGSAVLPISGSADAVEVTMTNQGYTGDPATAFPIMYTGSSNYGGTLGYYGGGLLDERGGSATLWQPGLDTQGVWNDALKRWEGESLGGPPCSDHYASGSLLEREGCATLGNANEWHEITIQMRPSSSYVCRFQPTVCQTTGAISPYIHDGILRVWWDGVNIVDFRPDAPLFRSDQESATSCANRTTNFIPNWNTCHTGIPWWRDERAVAPTLTGTWTTSSPTITNVSDMTGVLTSSVVTSGTGLTGRTVTGLSKSGRTITLDSNPSSAATNSTFKLQRASSPWCIGPCATGDPGADPTGFLLWVLSFPRGAPTQDWCNTYTADGSITGASANDGSAIITLSNTSGLVAGDFVTLSGNFRFNGSGSNAYGSPISSIDSATQITTQYTANGTTSGATLYYGSGSSSDLLSCQGKRTGDDPGMDDTQTHAEVHVWYDDWVVSTVPLPMKRRAGGSAPGRSLITSGIDFGLDARDLEMLPPNTFTRLWPGKDQIVNNTGYGTLPYIGITNAVTNGSTIRITTNGNHGFYTSARATVENVAGCTNANGNWLVTVIDSTTVSLPNVTCNAAYTSGGVIRDTYNVYGAPTTASFTNGAAMISATNYAVQIPTNIAVPLGGGFFGKPCAAVSATETRCLRYGGGHSGYISNHLMSWSSKTGRWKESSYVPDMSLNLGGAALGPEFVTPPGTGCLAGDLDPDNNYSTTGTISSGSPIITGIQDTTNMCPITGLCAERSSLGGGYAIAGTGIDPDAVIKTRDVNTASAGAGNGQVTMTHPATSSGTVTLTGGPPRCSSGLAPNGSPGGRGWWEHSTVRYGWDPRAQEWLVMQHSGTWMVRDAYATDLPISNVTNPSGSTIRITTAHAHGLVNGEGTVTIREVGGVTAANGAWKFTVVNSTQFDLTGPSGGNGAAPVYAGSYTAGSGYVGETWHLIATTPVVQTGDYTTLGVAFSPSCTPAAAGCFNRMLSWWGSSGKIYALDYGTGYPDFTGAQWTLLHTVSGSVESPQTDVNSKVVWDSTRHRLYAWREASESLYTGKTITIPLNSTALPITNASATTPVRYKTSVRHGLIRGNSARITGVQGLGNGANGTFTVGITYQNISGWTAGTPVVIQTADPHLLVAGDPVYIVSTGTSLDGIHTVASSPTPTATTFALAGTSLSTLPGTATGQLQAQTFVMTGSSGSGTYQASGTDYVDATQQMTGDKGPLLLWWTPETGTPCNDLAVSPCGDSGRFDRTKANYPVVITSPRDPIGGTYDLTYCYFSVCEIASPGMAYDPVTDAVYIVGRQAMTSQIMLYKLTDPLGASETWTKLTAFNFNTYISKNGPFPLYLSTSAGDTVDTEFQVAAARWDVLQYLPNENAFLLFNTSGSGTAGSATRGTGGTSGCALNGITDDCFRMYGFRFGPAGSGALPLPTFIQKKLLFYHQ